MLDLKEERKYNRLRKLAQELHIPAPEAFLTLEVFDNDGKLIQRHKQRSHSWTRNAYNTLFTDLAAKDATDNTFEAGKLSVRKTDGTISPGLAYSVNYGAASVDGDTKGFRAPAAEDGRGILVGSGTNAESFEDYTLQTQIAEGAGGGQLNHILSETHAISYGALVMTNTLIRYFNNNSGGGIAVNEVALVGFFGSPAYECVMSRDKLPSTVTVPDTGQLKVTYTIQLTYPS